MDKKSRRELVFMIKPASSAKRAVPDRGFMTDAVMEAIIAKSLAGAERCSFLFQGGEPTLAGLH